VIIILQDAIVGEKQSGTAAWVLSKPVSRPAFIVSKIIPNAIGVLVTMVLIPGAVAYAQIALATGTAIPPLQFIAAQGILWLNLIFYLTLTLMLGTLFNHRGPVIGLALAFLFGQQYLVGLVPALIKVLPYTLALPIDENFNAIAASVMLGQAPHSWLPAVSSAVLAVVFVAVSIWKFNQEEF
jgi:ABC-2 type transport system permease protein